MTAGGASIVSFMIRWLVIFCFLASSGAASARDMALVKIRLDRSSHDSYGSSDCEVTQPGTECIPWNSWIGYRATLLRTYGGRVRHKTFLAFFSQHSSFTNPVVMYAIAEQWEGGGDVIKDEYVKILWGDTTEQGFCLSPDADSDGELKKAGLADAVDELRRDHPCKER